MHVFIHAGLQGILCRHLPVIRILEVGFGTGLNALLTLIATAGGAHHVHYSAIEPFPLQPAEATLLNYCEQLKRDDLQIFFELMHQCDWERDIAVTDHFTLTKINTELAGSASHLPVHLIYFDAFAPAVQPGLWTTDVFSKMLNMLEPGGILVTYCSKSIVRRAMQAAGFWVEKLPGPRGKREMVRAVRPV